MTSIDLPALETEVSNAELAVQAAAGADEKGQAHLDHAKALRNLGRYEAAAAAMDSAVTLAPDDHIIGWHAALEQIRGGDWPGGLAAFGHHRVHDPQMWRSNTLRPFKFPHWNGGPLGSKKLLAYAEQGIGDQVMQIRALPAVSAASGQVVLECNRRLIGLFQRSFGDLLNVQYVRQTKTSADPLNAQPFDLHTSLLIAWAHLRTDPWAPATAYLKPDAKMVAEFKATWRGLGNGPNVGLSWRSAAPGHGVLRSIPLELTRRWRSGEAQFHSLQYDAMPAELEAESRVSGMPVHWDSDGDAKADLDRLAARIAALDLVITCDNTTAHLAGALGTPCWVLLPVASDWRWGRPDQEHRLYESVRLFWNTHPADWSGLANQVGETLRGWKGG